jgi:hypothetical protein
METSVEELPVIPPPQPKQRRKRINLALAGSLLTQGLSYDEVAPRVGAATGNSLRVNLGKRGLNLTVLRTPDAAGPAQEQAVVKLVRATESALRDKLNGGLQVAVDKATAKKVNYRDLASRGQGHAVVLKTLAETWRTLNGSPDQVTVQFGVSLLDASPVAALPQPVATQDQPIIDIEPASSVS